MKAEDIAQIIMASGARISFQRKSHTYLLDGKTQIPSVTTVLRMFNDVATPMVPRWVISNKGITGSIIHAITEHIDNNSEYDAVTIITEAMLRNGLMLNEENISIYSEAFEEQYNRIGGYVKSYKKFVEFYKPQWLLSEQVVGVTGERRPFAGMLDRFGILTNRSEKPVLLDIKTSAKPSISHNIQSVAYGMAAGDYMYDIDYAVLYLGKDEKFNLVVIDTREDIEDYCMTFRGLRFLYEHAQKV